LSQLVETTSSVDVGAAPGHVKAQAPAARSIQPAIAEIVSPPPWADFISDEVEITGTAQGGTGVHMIRVQIKELSSPFRYWHGSGWTVTPTQIDFAPDTQDAVSTTWSYQWSPGDLLNLGAGLDNYSIWVTAEETVGGWNPYWTDTQNIYVYGPVYARPGQVEASASGQAVSASTGVEVFQIPASSAASGTAAIVETTSTVDVQAQPGQVESSAPASSVLTGTFVDVQAVPAHVEAAGPAAQVDTVANVDIGGTIGQVEAAAPSQTVTAASGGPTNVDVAAAPGHTTTQLPGSGEYTYVFPRIAAPPAQVKVTAPPSDAQGFAPNVDVSAVPGQGISRFPAQERGADFSIVPLAAQNRATVAAPAVSATAGYSAQVDARPAQASAAAAGSLAEISSPHVEIVATSAALITQAPQYQVRSTFASDTIVDAVAGRGRSVAPEPGVFAENPDVVIVARPPLLRGIAGRPGIGTETRPVPPSVVGLHGRLSSRVALRTRGYQHGRRFRGGR
jgi:hypothetical protein